ncbi:MAG: hypothetical protein OEY29_16260 [Gammaproteobacteria bacterium]|nr:hypothetical protein [Gammaproteobacteria bacterium]
MSSNNEQTENKLVALASIAAELYSVMEVAWGVSLAAKNAKVISAQSKDKELGFQPITEFIDEISQQAMTGVDDINNAALRLTKIAVSEQRCANAYQRFNSVRIKNHDAQHIDSMAPAMQRVEENMHASTQKFKKSLNQLTLLLEAMDECMLSARAIASVSRIVTSNAQEHRAKLKVVADDLDEAATYIKNKLSDSYMHLNYVRQA